MADSMRSLNSFGVAGLLGIDCEIFYTNDLRARNIGRISDLISAQIRDSNADELRIRALLVYGVFQSYAIRDLPAHHKEVIPPVSIELGIDPSYVAVGVTYHWEGNRVPKWQGLEERIADGKPLDAFEATLVWINRHSTQLIIRYEEVERRIEVVSLVNRADSVMRDPIVIIGVVSSTAPLLEVANYHELGDLEYSKLLRNPTADSENVTIKADNESANGDGNVVLANQSPLDSEANELRALVADYEKVVSGLKGTVSELEARLEAELDRASERRFTTDSHITDDSVTTVKEHTEVDSEKKKEDDWGFHFMKQVWPFSKKEEDRASKERESDGVELTSEESTQTEETPSAEGDEFDLSDIDGLEEESLVIKTPDEEQVLQTEAALESAKVLSEIAALAKTNKSKKIETTLKEIEEEGDKSKAKRWVDSLSSELLLEKAKLNELQKNLAKQIRQRELEFKNSERSIKQELKRKEELLRSREAAIENKNEQIAQLNLAVERASVASVDKEQGQLKMKLDRAQRTSQMKEEESKALLVKVRDLENRLIIAQAKAQKGTDLQMQSKVQTLEKKVDEYKRVNQRLMESLNQSKDKSSEREVVDLRRKIDQYERQSNETKRTLDKSTFKLREAQESERKLQLDLARAIEENRNLRKSQGSGSGNGDSGGQKSA